MIKRSIGIFGTIFVLIAAISFSSVTTSDPAYAQTNDESGKTTCAIEKIGWILCPVIESFAKINDWAFKFIASNFLEVDADLFDNNSGTFTAWQRMRDIANIAFVLAFLILIYSQVTGMGAGSYGWKRMLPRLIIAAILVNSSYYICQLMVDVSNIIGYALQEMLNNIAKDLYANANNEYASAFENGKALPLQVLAVGILGSAAVWLLMPILGTVVLSTLVIMLVVIVLLLLRKALVVLLIFIAPLAFVAYLLPNTEKYFKKWMSMFTQLLLLFPVIALLFGAGQLASAVMLTSTYDMPTSSDPASTQTAAGNAVDTSKQSSMAMGLIAAAMAVLPWVATISVSKAMFAGMGMLAGAAATLNKGAMGRAAGAGKKWDQNSAYNRGKAIREQAKQNFKTQKYASQLSGGGSKWNPRAHYTRAASGGISGAYSAVTGGRAMLGGAKAAQTGLQRSALGASVEGQNKEVQNQMLALKNATDPIEAASAMLAAAAKSGDQVQAKAAQNVLMTSGGPGMDAFASVMANAEKEAIRTGNRELITVLKQNALQSHGGTIKEKGGVVAAWAGSKRGDMDGLRSGWDVDENGRAKPTNPFSGLSDSQIATQTTKSLQNAQQKNFISAETAHRILNNTSASENLGGAQRDILKQLAAGYTPPPSSGGRPPAPPSPGP